MYATDPILRVSVLSTGQVQIHPDHEAATWRPVAMWLLNSRRWTAQPQPGIPPLNPSDRRAPTCTASPVPVSNSCH